MKRILLLLVLCISPTIITSQSKIKASELIGCWKIYSEENKFYKNATVYRPCDYQSMFEKKGKRFRYKMVLESNHTCYYLTIGVSDIHKMKRGKWVFNKENGKVMIYNSKDYLIKSFKIQLLEKNLLLIQNIKDKTRFKAFLKYSLLAL
ncbi:hypothetical protein [Winogradskyella luteola]|uniref:Lipocalin-like domain-containing protein n=1 Tax=Winogradskyella luteola TaxID=2828330 RepID=A0A9X1F9E4_9FLAO|nr:hypothetical protein [Winogradskyella luteola]MBV7269511.1 hypothetical protein [Winogradskyella luteola]